MMDLRKSGVCFCVSGSGQRFQLRRPERASGSRPSLFRERNGGFARPTLTMMISENGPVHAGEGRAKIAIASRKAAWTRSEEVVEIVAKGQEAVAGETEENFFERYAGAVGHVWLYFGAFIAAALFFKWARKKQMELNNEQPRNPTIITTSEMEADLHVFKCASCGYEMYPARTREFKFFPENFKCPVCGAQKEEFWDLNDLNDPRNQEDEEDEKYDEEKREELAELEELDEAVVEETVVAEATEKDSIGDDSLHVSRTDATLESSEGDSTDDDHFYDSSINALYRSGRDSGSTDEDGIKKDFLDTSIRALY